MRTKEITLYTFDELSDEIKEKVLDREREFNTDYEWFRDSVFRQAEDIGRIIGIEIDRIYFSGFWSQGDGACFEGSYSYAKGSRQKIRECAPNDTELHKIADRLFDVQRYNFYGLMAWIKHSGHHYHEMCTDISVEHNECWQSVKINDVETVKDILRDYMRWIYRQLEREYEYLTSDEAVAESIRVNELEFTKDGDIA